LFAGKKVTGFLERGVRAVGKQVLRISYRMNSVAKRKITKRLEAVFYEVQEKQILFWLILAPPNGR
jgi:hypothetical protein